MYQTILPTENKYEKLATALHNHAQEALTAHETDIFDALVEAQNLWQVSRLTFNYSEAIRTFIQGINEALDKTPGARAHGYQEAYLLALTN